jgi:lipopolysaccharide heptosyltransferase II
VKIAAERILIVLLGAIGDVVRALPLANRLRAGYPDAHVAWAVEPRAAPILDAHPAIDERLVFERSGGVGAFLAFARRVRAGRFDLVLDLQRHAKSGLVSAASRAPVRIGFHRRNGKELNWLWNTHTIEPVEPRGWKLDQYQRFADFLELPASPPRFDLRLAASEDAAVAAALAPLTRPFAAFVLGSTWESRLWFADAYAEVVDALAARGLASVLVGGTDVRALAADVLRRSTHGAHDLTARTTHPESNGVLARARVAIAPDSGPMHLAAAAGTPVVSLWGATTPARSAPFGSEDLVLVGRVPCAPCYLRRCPIGRQCMQTITPARVLAQIDRALARAA